MREIATDTDLFGVPLRRGAVAARMVIAELDAVMNVVADRLDTRAQPPRTGPKSDHARSVSFCVSQYLLP